MHDSSRLVAAAPVLALLSGCPFGDGGSEDGQDDSDDTVSDLRLVIEPTYVVARQNSSVVVRVDVPDVPERDLPSAYAFDLPEEVSRIDVVTAPCPPGIGSRACQDWTITPRDGSIPGYYNISIVTTGSRAGSAEHSCSANRARRSHSWAEVGTLHSIRARSWNGSAWNNLTPPVSASSQPFLSFSMSRNREELVYSFDTPASNQSAAQLYQRAFDAFVPSGLPSLAVPRAEGLRSLSFATPNGGSPVVAGTFVNGQDLHELRVYAVSP
jgi:hypothetical protein